MPAIPKKLFLNAYMISTWIEIITDAGGRPHIVVVPSQTGRPITGFPKGFIEDHLKDNGRVLLNVSMAVAKMVYVDKHEGYVHLDIRCAGVSCPDIMIPVEAILDVYCKDSSGLSSFHSALPVQTNSCFIMLNEEREMLAVPCGVTEEDLQEHRTLRRPGVIRREERPRLRSVGISDAVDDHPQRVLDLSESVEGNNPEDDAPAPRTRGHLRVVK